MIKSKKENKPKKECQHELTFQTCDLGDQTANSINGKTVKSNPQQIKRLKMKLGKKINYTK